jgi:chemotaxis protein CheD
MRQSVGIGEYRVVKSPAVLVSLGLGSCVGVALYDPERKIGGLAHVMLPSSNGTEKIANPGKYADQAIRLMLEEMIKHGASRSRIVAKIAGGATMFKNSKNSIGERNVESVREILKKEGIKIVGEDTGKNYGRSIEFDIETGLLHVRSFKYGKTVL